MDELTYQRAYGDIVPEAHFGAPRFTVEQTADAACASTYTVHRLIKNEPVFQSVGGSELRTESLSRGSGRARLLNGYYVTQVVLAIILQKQGLTQGNAVRAAGAFSLMSGDEAHERTVVEGKEKKLRPLRYVGLPCVGGKTFLLVKNGVGLVFRMPIKGPAAEHFRFDLVFNDRLFKYSGADVSFATIVDINKTLENVYNSLGEDTSWVRRLSSLENMYAANPMANSEGNLAA